MKKIFFENGVWKGFEAPEKPVTSMHKEYMQFNEAVTEYNEAYAAARAAALTILNPEIIEPYFDKLFKTTGLPLANNIEHVWPGEWLVDKCWKPSGYVLSLPASSAHQFSEGVEELNQEKTLEQRAEDYADSVDRRGCSFWVGLKKGYMDGVQSLRDQLAVANEFTLNLNNDVKNLSSQIAAKDEEIKKLKETLRKFNKFSGE